MAIYQFGRCVIDSDKHSLEVSGIKRHIEPKAFDLLLLLVERSGEVVSQDTLIEKVWKGRIVSDSAISVRINAARKAVGDDGNKQAIIKTVPKRGFRLLADVKRTNPLQTESDGTDQAAPVINIKPVLGIFPFESHAEELPSHLVRGIPEDIATELSRFSEIAVIAPYSTFRHDFKDKDYFEVARSLGISHIVCGSLGGSNTVERVSVNLLSAENGTTLWSERYDFHNDDYFEIQNDLVQKIVSTLTQRLKTHLLDAARSKPPSNLSAYDRALELDPDYGRVRAWRECVYTYWWSSPPAESDLSEAISRINQAIALDESDHEIYRIKGGLHMLNGDHEQGDYNLSKAVEMNPNDAHVLVSAGHYRSYLADNSEDMSYIDIAFERNPLHPAWYWQHRAVTLFAHGQYEDVIKSLQRSPDQTEVSHLYRAASYAQLGQLDKAKQQIAELHAMSPDANINWLNIAYPTRCYEESEHRSNFLEGLKKAGLK